MWEIIEKWKRVIMEQVLWVETELKSKTGAEKLEAVATRVAGLFNLPFVPDFIETPLKIAAIKYVVELFVEKLNWVTGWNFAGLALTDEQKNKLVEVAEAPIPVVSKAMSAASIKNEEAITPDEIDARINELYRQYKVVAVPPIPVPIPEDRATETAETAVTQSESQSVVEDLFTRALKFTANVEGGKNYTGEANGKYTMLNPADKGGPTNRGITKNTLLAAYAQGIVKNDNLDVLTAEEAAAIYKANYWDKYRWGDIPWPVCLVLFDITVNHGGGGMAKIVQRTANTLGWKLEVDGKFGPKTFEAIKKISEAQASGFAQELLVLRKKYYDDIITRDSSQENNKNGWYNRIRALATAAGVKSPV
jgi:lysozyme family protein